MEELIDGYQELWYTIENGIEILQENIHTLNEKQSKTFEGILHLYKVAMDDENVNVRAKNIEYLASLLAKLFEETKIDDEGNYSKLINIPLQLQFSEGDMIVYKRKAYTIGEIDYDDGSIGLWDGDEMGDLIWKDVKSLIPKPKKKPVVKKNILTKRYVVEISVDIKKIADKYPNYRFNYDNPMDFIKAQANNIKFVADTDMSKNGMKEWGYSIKVKSK
jgi:hypothetical protein